MRSKVGRLHRKLLVIGAIILFVAPLAVWADGWTWLSGSSQNQQSTSVQSSSAVQKDDSKLTVVQAETGKDEPVVEVVNKSKAKKSSSFWTKLWHPTQWFSSSKKR